MTLPSELNDLYKYIQTINLKELGIRKKISVFIVVDSNNQYSIAFYITQKSRFLQKDADKIEEIKSIILENIEYKVKEKIILIKSPLCSKAKNKLSLDKWIVLG